MNSSMTGKRVARLQKRLRSRKIDALLVTQPENRRYLSGYTAADHGIQESSGVLLIPSSGAPFLLTDSRFVLQAEQEADGFDIKVYDKGIFKLYSALTRSLEIQTLAFESQYTLHSVFLKLQNLAEKKKITLQPTTNLIEGMREVKSDEELDLLRKSTALNEQVFQLIYGTIEPGMTEREIALAIELTMQELGAERPSFDTIVAFGSNAAKPHAVPTDRVLESGDIVLIDMGLVYKGYCSDMTRTFVAGKAGKKYRELHRIVREAQLKAIDALKPGARCNEVDKIARDVIKDNGYGKYFQHSLGHGVGIAVHEAPRLSPMSKRLLKSGMVVTVEPGIYLAEWGGIRLENIVAITSDGCELLNKDTTMLDI